MKDKLEIKKYIELTFELQQLVESFKQQIIDIEDDESGGFNISAVTSDVQIIYLPDTLQVNFKKFKNNQVKLYKICNYGKPATSIKYNNKHQYSSEKLTIDDFKDWYKTLKNRLKSEYESIEKEKKNLKKVGLFLSDEQKKDHNKRVKNLKNELSYFDEILDNFDKYEIVQSSFFKNYLYVMMNYQYYIGKHKKFGTTQLVNPIEKPFYDEGLNFIGKKPKANIIFLDMNYIQKPSIKTSEKVRAYLGSFDTVISGGRRDLFIKEK